MTKHSDFYLNYLKSPEWKAKRKKKLESTGFRCQRFDEMDCSGMLEVHHVTYARLGNELLNDLMVLCEAHHPIEDGARKLLGNSYQDFHTILPRFERLEKYLGSGAELTPEQSQEADKVIKRMRWALDRLKDDYSNKRAVLGTIKKLPPDMESAVTNTTRRLPEHMLRKLFESDLKQRVIEECGCSEEMATWAIVFCPEETKKAMNKRFEEWKQHVKASPK